MKRYLLLLVCTCTVAYAACCSCTPHDKTSSSEDLYVTIYPLRSIVGQITQEDFPIHVLVPSGASPETLDPTPKQIAGLRRAQLIFSVGLLDFERTLLPKALSDSSRLINMSHGIDLIAGNCSHLHDGEHTHGIDPHVWLSPRELRTMAANAYSAIHRLYPDSTRYTDNYRMLDSALARLDTTLNGRIARSGVHRLLIYHPALTYYARAYGIEQIAIEEEGKEPSARRLAELIQLARKEHIRSIFYQKQFPASTVETISRDIAGEAVALDPLAEEVMQNLETITDQLIRSNQ